VESLPPQAGQVARYDYEYDCNGVTSLPVLVCGRVRVRRTNMEPHAWTDEMNLKRYRKTIEMVNSQMEKMGLQRLHARTNEGFEIKVHASLFALSLANL
jgi:hypothetical protein